MQSFLFKMVYRMKTCPACDAPLVILMSQNKKICPDCKKKFDFYLKPKQKPLLMPSR